MAKNYVVLNFTDYRRGGVNAETRSTAVNSLTEAFELRVQRKGGSFHIHHMADLFGGLRLQRHNPGGHEVQGVLDEGWMRTLCLEAATYRKSAWNAVVNSVRSADKIIFAAHGLASDRDNVYTEHQNNTIRCGTIEGVIGFLADMLNYADRTDPTVTLVVCYAARSADYQKHHVNSPLNEQDIRSSLAFRVFCGLADFRPRIRLTARTGAVAADVVHSSLLSQTEEAIIANETIDAEFPGMDEDTVLEAVQKATESFYASIGNADLSVKERKTIEDRVYYWLSHGYDPDELDAIIRTIDDLDWRHQDLSTKLASFLGIVGSVAWSSINYEEVSTIEKLVARRHRLHGLKVIAEQKQAKYGKFIYTRDSTHIYVSRWVDGHLVQLVPLIG